MTQIFSESLRKGWSQWEIRALVIVSLLLQSILIVAGYRRKHSTRKWLRFILWITYLSADWLATVALSVLSIKHLQYDEDDYATNPNYVMSAFWAPFLLLHLGGPDTITAYSLEDNQLCWRHFLMLLVQVAVALHVFLRAWSSNLVNFLSIPMFVAGIIKFGERSWVLSTANFDYFRMSMFPSPDPGPNYARYMEDCQSRKAEGYKVSFERINEKATVGDHIITGPEGITIPEGADVHQAFTFFKTFKCLFADLILGVNEMESSQSYFRRKGCKEVFKVIEIELGFMYDLFYTKAVLIYSRNGIILRFISFSCVVSVFVVFFLSESKQAYSEVDIIITYILLAGAIGLEIYSVLLLLSSDWTMLWLSRCNNFVVDLIYKAISSINPPAKKKRWSNSIAQYNLLRLCRKDKPVRYRYCSFLQKVPRVNQVVEKYLYKNYVTIPTEVKELILKQLNDKSQDTKDFSPLKNFCSQRGRWLLEKYHKGLLGNLLWSTEDCEFDESILLWHIATDLCYYSDLQDGTVSRKNSKLLSDYMLYLLVMRPSMLPNGIGQIRFQDTCAEVIEFLEERKTIKDLNKACMSLLEVSTDIPPSEVKGDRSKSVLFDACRLAKDLQWIEAEQGWSKAKKWEFISHMWVEILSYAASQCQRSQHAQQLRQGGELLTHVWLLMAHLGITEQFQISKGHARLRLIVQ